MYWQGGRCTTRCDLGLNSRIEQGCLCPWHEIQIIFWFHYNFLSFYSWVFYYLLDYCVTNRNTQFFVWKDHPWNKQPFIQPLKNLFLELNIWLPKMWGFYQAAKERKEMWREKKKKSIYILLSLCILLISSVLGSPNAI